MHALSKNITGQWTICSVMGDDDVCVLAITAYPDAAAAMVSYLNGGPRPQPDHMNQVKWL